MTNGGFQQTPLFQMNLMLFLSLPSSEAFITPVFHNEGFVLHRVAPRIATPQDAIIRCQEEGLSIQQAASPEIVLRHEQRNLLVPIECKVNSFGPDSSNSTQARALLSFVCPYLADYFGLRSPDKWRSSIIYVVTGGTENQQQQTLEMLTREMRDARVNVAESGAVGIYIANDGIFLKSSDDARVPLVSLRNRSATGTRVMTLVRGEDPRPLFIIPIDPSIDMDDPIERAILEERIRQSVAAAIASRLDNSEFEFELTEILEAVTIIWELWRGSEAAAAFANAVRSYTRTVISELRKIGVNAQLKDNRIGFSGITPELAQMVRRYFESSEFRRGEVNFWKIIGQLDFSSIDSSWAQ